MSLTWWLIICSALILVLVIILTLTKAYTPKKISIPTPKEMEDQYSFSNPWGWDDKTASIPVEGKDGKCNVYTFTSSNRFTPAMPNYVSLKGCGEAGGYRCSEPLQDQVCVDDDQLFAIKVKHRCLQAQAGWDPRFKGLCVKQDGTEVIPETVEEYFQRCSPVVKPDGPTDPTSKKNNTRCTGSLSLIAFNANIGIPNPTALDEALCLQDPNDVSVNTSLSLATCDMRITNKGFPRELFRVQRATYDGTSFIASSTGTFARIIHRPTGYGVSPSLAPGDDGAPSPLLPVVGQPLRLYPLTIGNQGYWWVLVPQLQDPEQDEKKRERYISRAQLVHVPDPKSIPSLDKTKELWAYLKKANSAIPSSANKSSITLQPFRIVDSNDSATLAPSKLSQALLIDYSLAEIITRDISRYDFYDSFKF